MSTKKRRGSIKKRTVGRTTTRKKAALKNVTTGRKTKATQKAATKTKRVSASKPKGRKEPSRVKALVPREAATVVQETPPLEVVEVTRVEVIAVRGPSPTG